MRCRASIEGTASTEAPLIAAAFSDAWVTFRREWGLASDRYSGNKGRLSGRVGTGKLAIVKHQPFEVTKHAIPTAGCCTKAWGFISAGIQMFGWSSYFIMVSFLGVGFLI